MFFIDTKGANSQPADREPVKSDCVWQDEDDDHVVAPIAAKPLLRKLRQSEEEMTLKAPEYTDRLKKLRSSVIKAPKWAQEAKQAAEDEDEFGFESYPVADLDRALMSNSAASSKSDVLLPDYLNISKTQAIRIPGATDNSLESVRFHPQNPSVLLTSGMDKNLHLFKLSGSEHERLFSARFTDMPIVQSCWKGAGGEEVISVGRRNFFYSVDVAAQKTTRIAGVKGRDEREWRGVTSSPDGQFVFMIGAEGVIVVLSGKTKQWLANLKMSEGDCEAICCSPDGRYLFSVGQGSAVYCWDLKVMRCVRRFSDNGGTRACSVGVSADSSLLSVGSHSGIVNVYDLQTLLSGGTGDVSPVKTYENLLTPITGSPFHPSSQILTIYSREKRNALRMIHFPSGRVYTNWPTERSPLGRVVDVDFSCDGSTVAFGGKDGVVQIYNMKHFSKREQ